VIDIDRARLEQRIKTYFDPTVSDEDLRRVYSSAMTDIPGFEASRVRKLLTNRGMLTNSIIRYFYRPFDCRWLYWEAETSLIARKRPEYIPHVFQGNLWLEARQKQTTDVYDRGYFVQILADTFGNGCSSFFPLYLRTDSSQASLFPSSNATEPRNRVNMTESAIAYLQRLSAPESDLFYHTLSCLHSQAFRTANASALVQDWPRIPLTAQRETLLQSSELGQQVAALLDTETPVKGVTAGKPRPELKGVGVVARVGGGSLAGADWDVTARWGVAGKGGVCMPGKGKLTERAYTEDERTALLEGAAALGLDEAAALSSWGQTTFDVYLNDTAYWRNVPARVWSYTLGGYQVVKKWLSYREKALLGRGLTGQEATEVSHMIRRIAALLLLHPALDANYQAVKADPYPWPGAAAVP
jgi:hypothetical protein